MDEDEEDVRKLTEFIQKQKQSTQGSFEIEFQDFVSFELETSDALEGLGERLFDLDNEHLDDINPETSVPTSKQLSQFTEEEQTTIDNCTDPTLKRLLILNRSKNLLLLKMSRKLQALLILCKDHIMERREQLDVMDTKRMTTQTNVWKLAAPYFKDKQFFPSPLNADSRQKRARSELIIYDLCPSPKWSQIEIQRLISAVKCNFNINRQSNVIARMHVLKKQVEEEENKSLTMELAQLKIELDALQKDEELPPLHSNKFINWNKVSETFLKNKHTPNECQAVWQMLVHPDINKSEWTDEENKQLKITIKEYNYQNWEGIAESLNTNRTGFTTCLHYFNKLAEKFKKYKFSEDEDNFLMEVVNIYKVGNFIPWNKIVCHFNNRSRHQLYHRYMYFLSQKHVKKGKFSEAEDILLMILVNKFGKKFKKCAEYMPCRSQMQLKSRFNTNLELNLKKGAYTTEDDYIIYNHVQREGEKNWGVLTCTLSRGRSQIRQRYRLIKTFLKDNPNAKIEDIPKRNRRRLDEMSEEQYTFLKYMADQYKDVEFIPTLSMIEDCLQVEMKSFTEDRKTSMTNVESDNKLKNIDELLIDFFGEKITNSISESSLTMAAENVINTLKLLGANLEIPKHPENIKSLDNIDLEILERISKNNINFFPIMNQSIPPNVSTLLGLKHLILKHKEYKSYRKNEQMSAIMPNDLAYHHDLFSKRFQILFNWSAVLSLEKPNESIIQKEVHPKSASHKRPASDHTVPPKRAKCFPFVEVMLSETHESVNNSDSVTVDDSDAQDVQKLNVLLETIKAKLNRDCSDDDDVPMSTSIQALKNIRKKKSSKR